MQCASFLRQYARSIAAALVLLVGTGEAFGTDTYSSGTLSAPSVTIGNATFTNMVVTVGSIVKPPSGSTGNGTSDTYDPTTNQLTIPNVQVGTTTFHNVIITVGSLVSVQSVSGADSYSPPHLSISSVQVGSEIYNNVTITVAGVDSLLGGMPNAVRDNFSGGHLSIPAVQVGTRVFTNATITVGSIVSVGGIDVPNVVGMTQAAATTALAAAHLVVGSVTTASSGTVPAGDVISQTPAAGANATLGSSVNLVISTGSSSNVTVPNVVGLTQAAATTAITAAQLVLGSVTTASSGTVPAGDVISESPAAGTSVAKGSAVNLVVSTGSGGGGGGIGTGLGWFAFVASPIAGANPAGQNGLFVLTPDPLAATAANIQWVIPNTTVKTVGASFVWKGAAPGSGYWPYAGIYAALDSNNIVEIYQVNLTNASASVPTAVPVGNFVAKHVSDLSLICDAGSVQTNILDATSWFVVIHIGASSACDASTGAWVVVTQATTTTVNIKTTSIDTFYNPSGMLTGMVLNDPATNNILLYADKSFTSPTTLFTGATMDQIVHSQTIGTNSGLFGNGSVEFRELGKTSGSPSVYRLDYTGASSFKAIPSYNPGTDTLSYNNPREADATNFYFTDTNSTSMTETLYQEPIGSAGSTPTAPIALYSASVTPFSAFSVLGSNGSLVVLENSTYGAPGTASLGTVPVGVAHTATQGPLGPPGGYSGNIAASQMLDGASSDYAHSALFIDQSCIVPSCTTKTHPDSTEILSVGNTTLQALTPNSKFLPDANILNNGYVLQIRGVTDTATPTDGGGKLYALPSVDNAGSYSGLVFEGCLTFSAGTCTTPGDFVVPTQNVLAAVIGLSSAGNAAGVLYKIVGTNVFSSGVVANVSTQQIGAVSLTNTVVAFAF
jgi:hypothetical protein